MLDTSMDILVHAFLQEKQITKVVNKNNILYIPRLSNRDSTSESEDQLSKLKLNLIMNHKIHHQQKCEILSKNNGHIKIIS